MKAFRFTKGFYYGYWSMSKTAKQVRLELESGR